MTNENVTTTTVSFYTYMSTVIFPGNYDGIIVVSDATFYLHSITLILFLSQSWILNYA